MSSSITLPGAHISQAPDIPQAGGSAAIAGEAHQLSARTRLCVRGGVGGRGYLFKSDTHQRHAFVWANSYKLIAWVPPVTPIFAYQYSFSDWVPLVRPIVAYQ